MTTAALTTHRDALARQLEIDATAKAAYITLRPAPAVSRSTTHEVAVGDVSIPEGSQVWMCLEAASREDSGAGRRHWGFGGGIHRCLGAFVARLELATLVSEWLRRIPDFEVAPGFAPSIVHEPRGLTRLAALPLRWDSTVTARMGAS